MRLSANSQQIKNGRTQFAPTVRRRLHRIVRNSLWLSLTHFATPPFPQKSRSARLFGCKRPLDGSLSLPTFADLYIAFSRELSFVNNNITAAASHRPTTSSFAPYRSHSLWLSLRLCKYFNSYAVKWGITKLKRPLNLHKLRAFARRYNAHQGKSRPYFLPVHFPDVYPFLLRRKRILCNQKRRKP